MKIKHKIGFGLTLLVALLAFVLFHPGKVHAATTTYPEDTTRCTNTLGYVNNATLECKFKSVDGSSQVVTFISSWPDHTDNSCNNDPVPGDSYTKHCIIYAVQGDYFCNAGTSEKSYYSTYYDVGINLYGGNDDLKDDQRLDQDFAGKKLKLVFQYGYLDQKTNTCKFASNDPNKVPSTTISGVATQNVARLLQFTPNCDTTPDSCVAQSFDGVTSGRLSGRNLTLTNYQGNAPGNTLAFQNGYAPGACSGEVIFIPAGSNQATRYVLTSGSLNSGTPIELKQFLEDPTWGTQNCTYDNGERNYYATATSFRIQGTPPNKPNTSSTGAPGAGGSANGGNDDLCLSSTVGFALAWIMCPVLSAANAIANNLTATFEAQLSFTLYDKNHTSGTAVSCVVQNGDCADTNKSGQGQLKHAWSIFRLIASSLLVIILLVVILSEAIGVGPFDAYAIRKMLPRVVAAVILIQLSWPIGVWVVNAVDDLARQLANIMYLPFGGTKNMDLGSLLDHAGINAFQAGAFSWIALLGIIIAAVFALPLVLMFCFMAIMAILTGLIVLIFRKIIIIMALLFMPLAIIAWILPGTQRYWKLWSDNFIKALFMFPLAIAMIAAGRIFAYVAATQDTGTLITFLIVMVGFFGPLFLLPKTWKWGGQVMKLVGGYADSASAKLQERPNKYFKARQEDWSAARKDESARRYGKDVPFNAKRFWQYPLDRFRGGQYDPLMGRAKWMPAVKFNRQGNLAKRLIPSGVGTMSKDARMRRNKMTTYKGEGEKKEQEDQAMADKEAVLREKSLNEQEYNHDLMWQDKLHGNLDNYNKRYQARDLARHIAGGGTAATFESGYRDNYGRVMSSAGPSDTFEEHAILNRLRTLGADTNIQEMQRYIAQEQGATGPNAPERRARVQKWLDDNKDFVLEKFPHHLKGLASAADGDVAGMHGAGGGDLVARIAWDINNPALSLENSGEGKGMGSFAGESSIDWGKRVVTKRRRAQASMGKAFASIDSVAHSPQRDRIEQGQRRMAKAVVTDDEGEREDILVRDRKTLADGINTNRRRRVYADGRDLQTRETSLPAIEVTKEVLEAIPQEVRKSLNETFNAAGDYVSPPGGRRTGAQGAAPGGGGGGGPGMEAAAAAGAAAGAAVAARTASGSGVMLTTGAEGVMPVSHATTPGEAAPGSIIAPGGGAVGAGGSAIGQDATKDLLAGIQQNTEMLAKVHSELKRQGTPGGPAAAATPRPGDIYQVEHDEIPADAPHRDRDTL